MRQLFGKTALPSRSTAFALAAALASAAPVAAAALTLDGPEAAVGQWELSLASGAPNSCRLALRGEQVHGGFFVGMPPGCRRALPILSNVVAWILPGDNRLDLADAYGKPLLDFSAGDAGALSAAGPRGEVYHLTFVEGAPAQRIAATAKASPPHVILRPSDVAGRYAVLREGGRDTGCMVTLETSSKAFLSPACRDQGIVLFDPAAWRMVGGRLVLVARKGHTAQLDLQPDGSWLKEAKDADAKSLTLKKF